MCQLGVGFILLVWKTLLDFHRKTALQNPPNNVSEWWPVFKPKFWHPVQTACISMNVAVLASQLTVSFNTLILVKGSFPHFSVTYTLGHEVLHVDVLKCLSNFFFRGLFRAQIHGIMFFRWGVALINKVVDEVFRSVT